MPKRGRRRRRTTHPARGEHGGKGGGYAVTAGRASTIPYYILPLVGMGKNVMGLGYLLKKWWRRRNR